MNGIIVYNFFLQTKKYMENVNYFLNSAKKKGIELKGISNSELILSYIDEYIQSNKISFAIFFDKDIRLAEMLEKKGVRVFNSSKSIESCDDKSLTYIRLLDKGIRMPKTIVMPKIYKAVLWDEVFPNIDLVYPLIVKECFGSFGNEVYLTHNKQELIEVLNSIGEKPSLLQEYISSSYGRDIRIQVVGGKVVAAMLRHSNGASFKANISSGATAERYEPNIKQKEMAINACKILGLDFAGVDILFGEDDEPILCEVNSNAHFINLEKYTGVNVADYIIDYIKEELTCGNRLVNI